MTEGPPTCDRLHSRANLHSFTRGPRANSLLNHRQFSRAARRQPERPGRGSWEGQSADARSPDHEKIYGWREKRCFAAWQPALYFGGSARTFLAPHLQEHEK